MGPREDEVNALEVAVIILNWNRPDETLQCLRSVERLEYPNVTSLVVDNGSTDDSVALIRRAYPGVALLEAGENRGYTGGNNLGIEYALEGDASYIWLLNDDVLVAPDSLSILMEVALDEPLAGFLGPMVYMREEPRRILSAGCVLADGWQPQHRGMGEMDRGQFDAVTEVDSLSGCSLLVSRQAIEAIGALDDDFYAYYEDVDWCYRGTQAGFRVLVAPQAIVWHPDTRHRDPGSPLVTYYMARNRLLFGAKHRLGTGLLLQSVAGYLRQAASWSLRPKWRHKRRQRDALLRAMVDALRGRFGRAAWLP